MVDPRQESARSGPTGVGLGLRWAFIDEVEAGAAPSSIAFFEVSPENYMRRGGYFPAALERVVARHPVITHGLMLNIGGETLDRDYLDNLRAFLRALGATRHSDHLCWTGHGGRCLHDLLPLPLDSQTARHVADQVRRVQDHLGVAMSLENISYYASPGLPPTAGAELEAIERDFLCEILERADCGLMLDVNNIHVNAVNHGFSALRFLEGLPLDRVVQLHVAGGERRPHLDDLIIDTHGADVSDEVAALMAWVIERTGPLPVLYERDHKIPPLSVLGEQVASLDRVYQDALTRHRDRQPTPRAAIDLTGASAHPSRVCDTLGGVLHGLERVIRDRDPLPALARDPEGYFGDHGLSPADAAAIVRMGAKRLEVYRRLPRGGVEGTLDDFLPRTRARLGAVFQVWVDRWFDEEGPRSRYLRDLPAEFVAWVAPRWREAADIPSYLVDLARHEIIDYEVAAAPPASAPSEPGAAFALERGLRFDASVRVIRHAHAVHELPADVDDRSEPRARATTLLVYRDAKNRVRFLELSPLAAAVIDRLHVRAQTVREALVEGAQDAGEALDDAVLARMSALLADLAERGVVTVA